MHLIFPFKREKQIIIQNCSLNEQKTFVISVYLNIKHNSNNQSDVVRIEYINYNRDPSVSKRNKRNRTYET